MDKGISIIICSHNGEARIPKVLEHLNSQIIKSPLQWEVILVDNASTDKTVSVANSHWKSDFARFKVVHEHKIGLSYAREKGIMEAGYDIICFVDDDNWLNQQWVSRVYEFMDNHPEIVALGGKGEGVYEIPPPFWFEQYKNAYAIGRQTSMLSSNTNQIPYLYGAGLTLRKSVWLKLKQNGFTQLLTDRQGKTLTSGGDYELSLVLQLCGYKLHYDDTLVFKHYMPAGRLNWNYLKKLYYSFGKSSTLIDIYKSELKEYNGYKRFKATNAFFCLSYSIYLILVNTPLIAYEMVTGRWKEGSSTILSHQWRKGKFIGYLGSLFDLRGFVKQIKTAPWRSLKNNTEV